MAKYFSELAALTSCSAERKSVQIPGPQHHSDVKSGVVAVMGIPGSRQAQLKDTRNSGGGEHHGQAAMQYCSLFQPYAGLRLAIAQDLVEAHGGPIKVESAVGRDSTFKVSSHCV